MEIHVCTKHERYDNWVQPEVERSKPPCLYSILVLAVLFMKIAYMLLVYSLCSVEH